MIKTVTIDASPYVSKLWSLYNGDLTKKRWLKTKEVKYNILEYIKEKLHDHEFYQLDNAKYNLKVIDALTQEVTIEFQWEEKENIHHWAEEVKEDYRTIANIFTGELIIAANFYA